MEDVGIVMAVLRLGLLLVMVGATVVIFREIIPMARGRAPRSNKPGDSKE